MIKRLIAAALALLLFPALQAAAEVIPAYGPGQIGYQAVVLCQSLTVRESPSASSKAVETLKAGAVFATQSSIGGWTDCFRSENEGMTGWVKSDYVIIDPAWYKTDAATPVYAWSDESACQVGLLDRDERYPILKAEGEWLCIGLRGAAGWIHDPQGAAQARTAAFYPADLANPVRADLITPDGAAHPLSDPAALKSLGALLSRCHPSFASACPFDAHLTLTLADGRTMKLEMATDSCHVFRIGEDAYYQYGDGVPRDPMADSSANIGEAFWALFGLKSNELH